MLLGIAIAGFLWAVRHGQFDNLDREAHRILFDEDLIDPPAGQSTPQPRQSHD
jgi:cbb3-type cytochrome oxidase maturation protein